jgi:O-antigen ligase
VPLLVSWVCVALLIVGTSFTGGGLNKERSARAITNAWLLAALVSAAMGLLQYFGKASALSPWVSNLAAGEAYANLRQRNQFATLCSIGLMALLWRVAAWQPLAVQNDQVTPNPRPRLWLLWGAGVLLLACGNAASGSRTGLLQWWLVAVLGIAWWLQGRRENPKRPSLARFAGTAFVALVVYLACLWLLPWLLLVTTGVVSGGLLGRFNEETGCSSRRILWANVLHLIAQKPWLGWGWGELGFAHFVSSYPGERFCDILDNAHNLPLHLAVELGVPFAASACTLLVWLVWRAQPWQASSPTRQLAWGALAVVGLHSLVEYPLWYGPFQMAAGLSVWLLWINPSAADQQSGSPPQCRSILNIPPIALVIARYVALLLVVHLGFATWSYWRVSQLYVPQADRAAAYREDTMGKVHGTWLFQNQVQFAELTTTPLAADNAEHLHALAFQLLHFSPEPRVIEKLIESAVMLGRNDVASYYLQRFKVAFPKEHAQWAKPLISEPLAGDKTP